MKLTELTEKIAEPDGALAQEPAQKRGSQRSFSENVRREIP